MWVRKMISNMREAEPLLKKKTKKKETAKMVYMRGFFPSSLISDSPRPRHDGHVDLALLHPLQDVTIQAFFSLFICHHRQLRCCHQ
jgi:hypothetical protein